jgi:hypothetical protein
MNTQPRKAGNEANAFSGGIVIQNSCVIVILSIYSAQTVQQTEDEKHYGNHY